MSFGIWHSYIFIYYILSFIILTYSRHIHRYSYLAAHFMGECEYNNVSMLISFCILTAQHFSFFGTWHLFMALFALTRHLISFMFGLFHMRAFSSLGMGFLVGAPCFCWAFFLHFVLFWALTFILHFFLYITLSHFLASFCNKLSQACIWFALPCLCPACLFIHSCTSFPHHVPCLPHILYMVVWFGFVPLPLHAPISVSFYNLRCPLAFCLPRMPAFGFAAHPTCLACDICLPFACHLHMPSSSP